MTNPQQIDTKPSDPESDDENGSKGNTRPFIEPAHPQSGMADETVAISLRTEYTKVAYIRTAQLSDIGTHRKQNEDTAMSMVSLCGGEKPLVPFSISLVADGMGGHADGADASRTVANYVSQNLLSRILIPLMSDLPVNEPVQSIMEQAVLDASRVIHTTNSDQIGGTTLTCGVIIKSRLFLAHVGDSRAYLYDSAQAADDESSPLKQLTRDHSYVQQLIDSGEITLEEAAVHPRRNLLYRAITGSDVEVDMFTCALPKTGILLVCSDGMWGSVNDSLIQEVIAGKGSTLQQKCEQLVALAIEGGTTDNISVVLTEFRI